MRQPRRTAQLAAAALMAVVVGGCGGGGSATVDHWLGPDAVVTRAVSTTTSPPASADGDGGAASGTRSPQSQQYTVRPNDSVSKIASVHGVGVDALVGINEWGSANDVTLMPGDVINIPPNGLILGAASSGSGAADSGGDTDDADDAAESTPGTCTDGDDAERYTIVAGDNPSKVAAAHDITLEELRAANEGNSAMTRFNVGQQLYLPC